MTLLTRRNFLKSISAGLVGGLSLGATGSKWSHAGVNSSIVTELIEVPIAGLPPLFESYRIGFLTDIHLGVWVSEDWIRQALDMLSGLQIDLLVLGGDYILVNESHVLEALGMVENWKYANLDKPIATTLIYESIATILNDYNVFPDGILAVVGNHDRWNLFPEFLRAMRRCKPVKLLINEEISITRSEQSLHLFGSDDYLTGLPCLPPELSLVDGRRKRIIITHNPDYVSATLNTSYPRYSLALCGHTHGGQIVLPGLGAVAAQVQDRRFISGFSSIGDVHVYTSRGLGYVGLPVRFHCPPEITVLTLTGG